MIIVVDVKQNPIKETVDLKRKGSRKNQVDALKAYLASGQSLGDKRLVFMQRNKEIEWIYTIDSDVLPLGATNVIHEVRVSVCVGTLAGLTSLSLSLYPSLPGLL